MKKFFFGQTHLNMLQFKKKIIIFAQRFGFYKIWVFDFQKKFPAFQAYIYRVTSIFRSSYTRVTFDHKGLKKTWTYIIHEFLLWIKKIFFEHIKNHLFDFQKQFQAFLAYIYRFIKNFKLLLHGCNIWPKRVKKNLIL